MAGGVVASGTREARAAQLAFAYDEVAAVLEHVDLREESEPAEETIAGLAALDRALAIVDGER